MKLIKCLAATALVVAASCGGGGSDYVSGPSGQNPGGTTGGTQTGGSTNPVQTNQVTVNDNFFTPTAVQVGIGTTVTWTWASGASLHNVTFSDANSGDKSSGTFSKTFNAAGTFTYRCTLHSGMDGSVIVQ